MKLTRRQLKRLIESLLVESSGQTLDPTVKQFLKDKKTYFLTSVLPISEQQDWYAMHYPGAYVEKSADQFERAADFLKNTAGKRSSDELAGVPYHTSMKERSDSIAKKGSAGISIMLKGVITSIYKHDAMSSTFKKHNFGGPNPHSGFVRHPYDKMSPLKSKETFLVDDAMASKEDLEAIVTKGNYIQKLYPNGIVKKTYFECFVDNWQPVGIVIRDKMLIDDLEKIKELLLPIVNQYPEIRIYKESNLQMPVAI